MFWLQLCMSDVCRLLPLLHHSYLCFILRADLRPVLSLGRIVRGYNFIYEYNKDMGAVRYKKFEVFSTLPVTVSCHLVLVAEHSLPHNPLPRLPKRRGRRLLHLQKRLELLRLAHEQPCELEHACFSDRSQGRPMSPEDGDDDDGCGQGQR
jgi:hypothetical protein